MSQKIVCIIDDDEIYQFTTKRMIELKGLTEKVISFYDGERAIRYLQDSSRNEVPDIIFLDINMPMLDGWQFLNEFRKLKQHIDKEVDIYLVSSSNDSSDQQRAERFPEIREYIVKPFTFEQLKECISN